MSAPGTNACSGETAMGVLSGGADVGVELRVQNLCRLKAELRTDRSTFEPPAALPYAAVLAAAAPSSWHQR